MGLFDNRLLCVAVPLRPLETFCWAVTLAPCQRAAIAIINAQVWLGREARSIKSAVGSVKHGLPLRFPCPVPWDGNRPDLAFGCSSLTSSCSPSSPPHRAADKAGLSVALPAFIHIPLFLFSQNFCSVCFPAPLIGSPLAAAGNPLFLFLLSLQMQIAGECPRGPCKGLGNDERASPLSP